MNCVRSIHWSQSYSIDWHQIASGSGTSSNGEFTATGRIGQPDAGGSFPGGNFSLTGGFWRLISVSQTPGAPTLPISRSGNTVTIYWQAEPGWTNLEQNTRLAALAIWTTNADCTAADGPNYLNLAASSGNLFFRLEHP